jgi:hypothetical protein
MVATVRWLRIGWRARARATEVHTRRRFTHQDTGAPLNTTWARSHSSHGHARTRHRRVGRHGCTQQRTTQHSERTQHAQHAHTQQRTTQQCAPTAHSHPTAYTTTQGVHAARTARSHAHLERAVSQGLDIASMWRHRVCHRHVLRHDTVAVLGRRHDGRSGSKAL